jgi:hypothetical protein
LTLLKDPEWVNRAIGQRFRRRLPTPIWPRKSVTPHHGIAQKLGNCERDTPRKGQTADCAQMHVPSMEPYAALSITLRGAPQAKAATRDILCSARLPVKNDLKNH